MRELAGCISKSQSRALGCQTYFANEHLDDHPIAAEESSLGRVGTQIHKFRSDLVRSLVTREIDHDWKFWEGWAKTHSCDQETLDLLECDRFILPHPNVVGTELFLSVDDNRSPLESGGDHEPGYVSENPFAIASGTLDLVMLPERTVLDIRDLKTGWSHKTISEFEPAFYAALGFAHYPAVESVRFTWEFMRHRATRTVTISRDDLDTWVWPMILSLVADKHKLIADFRSGVALDVNPWAGLCVGCNIACSAMDMDRWSIGPIRNKEDAAKMAERMYLARGFALRARDALEPFISEHGDIELGPNFVATIHSSSSVKYPLPQVLGLLGLEIPAVSPEWDVPLKSLTLSKSQLSGFARAQKREGIAAELESIGKRSARTEVRVERVDPIAQGE